MIKGMTGFGSCEMSSKETKLFVEARSVNHRYLDISFYLPSGFGALEQKIRQMVQKHLERGRLTISVRITEKAPPAVVLNKAVVRKHLTYAHQLSKEFHLKNDLTMSDILRLPGVVEVHETFIEPDELWPLVERGLQKSLTALVSMRLKEGKSLAADLTSHLKVMSTQLMNIRKRSHAICQQKQKTMTPEEFKSFQKSNDVSEELARMNHYINQLRIHLKGNKTVGKEIDFIAQEMQRETNTIGSKVQDSIVSNAVIVLKSHVEKIREQAQNIE